MQIIDDIPVITEYSVTILFNDRFHTEYFYKQQEVVTVLNKLDKLGKKYILMTSVHTLH